MVPSQPEATTSQVPQLQDGAGYSGKGDLKEVGIVGALLLGVWNMV